MDLENLDGTVEERNEEYSKKNAGKKEPVDVHKTVISQAKLAGWLVSYSMNPLGQSFEIRDGRYIIGCDAKCDVRFYGDDLISRKHAILVYRNGKFILEDEMSTHGTYVNSQEILGQTVLKNYDEIRIGNTILTLVVFEKKLKDDGMK